jgi:hypothetical protein
MVSLLLTALAAVSVAAPVQLRVQGRLLDAQGQSVTGTQRLEFRVWDSTGSWSSPAFTEVFSAVNLDDGYYAVTLGAASTALEHGVLDGTGVSYAVAVGPAGSSPLPAQALGSVAHAAWTTAVRATSTAPVSCGPNDVGALYFDTSANLLRACGNTGWMDVGIGTEIGATPTNPGRSCQHILNARPLATSGTYWIDPQDTPTVDPVQRYCLMSYAAGGGWTLVAQGFPSAGTNDLCATGAVGTLDLNDTTVSGPAKLSNAEINATWDDGTTQQVLMLGDLDNSSGTSIVWDRKCVMDFVDAYDFTTAIVTSSLSSLETSTVSCSVGTSFTISTGNAHAHVCGYYYSGSGSNALYSATTTYGTAEPGGACGTTPTGRAWPSSPGNYGCNTWKLFIR